MELKNKDLKRRIIEISYKHHLSHLGSNLTAVDIIDEIYATKKPDEKFVLSSGHSGLALYIVLEKYYSFLNAEDLFNKHGVHPNRDERDIIEFSSGSLGHGLPAAVGMALADRSKNVYCLLSDGECAEGSIWESFRVINENKLINLKIYINANGYGAYKKISRNKLENYYFGFWLPNKHKIKYTNMNDYPSWLQGQQAHYKILSETEYKEVLEIFA